MRFTHALRALSLSTVIAITAITIASAPVSATDPAPTPSPDASTPVATIAPDPTTSPDPAATADPAATTSPDPSTDPAATPAPDPSMDPAATPDPLASPDPAATPAPDGSVTSPLVTAPAAAAIVAKPKPSIRKRIVRIALAQRHKAYVRGGVGPRSFDCSGLVRYVFRKAGVSSKLGGGHSARAMYRWAVRHHLTSRHNPHIGDVVVWGRGKHVGIYIGHGKAISALNPRLDIRITRINALSNHFTAYIHVRVGR